MRLALLLLLSALCSGCFVLNEIDSGMEIMEAHTPEDKKKPAAAKAGDEPEKPPTYSESVQGWFQNAKTLGPRKKGGENPMVQCKLGGSTRFTRRTDCQSQGGQEV